MGSISIHGLVKKYDEVVAVAGIDLHVKDKEFVALLGPSGSGKTTTLRCVAGLEQTTQGRIEINNRDVTKLQPADRDIAFVFQSYALYPHLSVYDNMAFPLRAVRAPKAEVDERVQKAAATLQIARLLGRKPNQLSGGEQQRAALGRAIVRRPAAFLMDEPLTNLDAQLRTVMRAELKRLQTDLGATTLYVTHDQMEAMSMGDRIAVFNEGKIQQDGTPMEVYNTPKNLFVAGFIGSPPMNFIRGVLSADKASLEIEHGPPIPLQLSSSTLGQVEPGKAYIYGVRPEDIRLHAETKDGTVPCEVYVVEPLGSENIVNIKVGGQIVKARTAPSYLPAISQPLWAEFEPERSCLFDPESTEAIR